MSATALVKKVSNIFSLPEVVWQVSEILRQPDPDFTELEAVILHDPGLTASILKLANSSFYSFPGKVDMLTRAISLIGLRALKGIVIGAAVTRQFKDISSDLVNMDVFWFHSVTRAILAKDLAIRCQCSQTERFFIAGLLSSIGKLILYTQYPAQSAAIIQQGKCGEAELAAAERAMFGFDYAELSAELLKAWQLPAEIWEMIAFQLNPLAAAPRQTLDACILHVALSVSSVIQPSVGKEILDIQTQVSAATLEDEVLATLQTQMNEIEVLTQQALYQSMDVLTILRPETMMIF